MTATRRWERGRGWQTPWVALARFVNAVYFLLTASYCILTYSSFAYQQFIRPRLVASLTAFIVWHPLWHWLALAITVATLMPALRDGPGKWTARTYVAAMALLGLALTWRPILPSVENDGAGLRLAALFLLPPLWLAVCDHLTTASAFVVERSSAGRVVRSSLLAAIAVWGVQLASVPLRLGRLGDLPLGTGELAFGAATSLAVHLAVFGALALATVLVLQLSRTGHAEYWGLAALSACVTWLVLDTLVFAALSFSGLAAVALAAELAVVLTAVWSGVARFYVASTFARSLDDESDRSAVAAWFSPFGITNRRLAVAGAVALPLAVFVSVQRASTFDWNFLVQNLIVMAAWLAAAAIALAAVARQSSSQPRALPTMLAAGVLLTAGVARGPAASALDAGLARQSFVPEFALDAYAAVEPSYRLIRQLLWVEPAGSRDFFQTLRRNSLIQHVDVTPIDVNFVSPPLAPATARPDIYLFVIDSLRRDYLAPYNPAVQFTPSLAAFAREADTFTYQRHFARYGGTGLSMAAMWAGGMVLHKEYVLPFAPMNALGKLLTANRYHAIASPDHITEELVAPTLAIETIDRDRDEMQYDFCASLSELQQRVHAQHERQVPIFGHTRSLNLHVSKLTTGTRAEALEAKGFVGAAVTAVHRMDGCFGEFIDFLKREGRYDRSIVILTSDHGDSLGEAMRWGHSYTLFPEIVRTPLLMHVPAPWRGSLITDTDQPTFSTDVAPTLYALLGYQPADKGWMYGRPLFRPAGTPPPHSGEKVLIASSYGPVYGIVEDDGRWMYMADAVNTRDYAYDLTGVEARRVGISAEQRAESRAWIANHVSAIADAYHFVPAR